MARPRAARMNAPFEERLWAKIAVSADKGACWEWQASLSTTGYGQIRKGKRTVRAHREVCLLVHGQPPEGEDHVLHSCDNPLCCNPHHLSWGSRSKNIREARDRNFVGKQKITPAIADAIRRSTERTGILMRRYSLSRWQIANIRSGRQWKTG